MIAVPEEIQHRIARELRQEEVIKLARHIEDRVLTKTDNDFRLAIHELSLELAELMVR
jgi:hypothetical protein